MRANKARNRATVIQPLIRLTVMAYQHRTTLARARKLRRDETSAEQRLWEELRGRRLNGHKFVRQLPIGPYVADFACRGRRLIVEVDGATHGDRAELAHDQRRTAFLEQQGWRVLRVWNEEVYSNLNGVCDSILLALGE